MTMRTVYSMLAMLMVSLGSLVYMTSVGLPIDFESERRASMTIEATNGLVVGSRVLLRGVDIGTVTAIEPNADAVRVEWKYKAKYRLPVDSDFRVDTLSALSESYVGVLPAADLGPYLGDDAVIDSARVTVPSTINDLSEHLTRLLNQLDTEQIRSILGELEIGLPSGSGTIDTIERAGAITAAMLEDTTAPLSEVLVNAQSMLVDSSFIPPGLSGTAGHIVDFGRGFDGTMSAAVLLTNFSPLPDSLVLGTGPLIGNLQAFLDRSAADIKILAVDSLPAAQSAAQSMRTVNLSALLDGALAPIGEDGVVTVNIGAGR
ncbi:hypothetical protein CH306_25870 [Rhodococcus sp. 15-725-2-2b]|uniref:MlaD family protein n=1 Tax=unclassified Rhodococcus (in: high G+C Gram-positive bacteria) TaxID=192944 RepID=UPI000B9A676C|nr:MULTISPECIES: MlaD family protein [unclassified Rhodococcus (in: high G+C Gram-positive bacteria)]OZC63669.1 hypothetical protein CH277_22790 [Rhodococcus sp. 06-469-3-2]OZD40834.1 hypothetical protein CH264_24475 [Rhodococcus sp. 06-1477-1A]OZE67058.1 hypothetical protein CH306_25870 [Rhodococcus sp. 15-725-2-2b]